MLAACGLGAALAACGDDSTPAPVDAADAGAVPRDDGGAADTSSSTGPDAAGGGGGGTSDAGTGGAGGRDCEAIAAAYCARCGAGCGPGSDAYAGARSYCTNNTSCEDAHFTCWADTCDAQQCLASCRR